jgi:hypothetical protein
MTQNDCVPVTCVHDIVKSEMDVVTHESSSHVNVKQLGRKPRSAVTNFLVQSTGKGKRGEEKNESNSQNGLLHNCGFKMPLNIVRPRLVATETKKRYIFWDITLYTNQSFGGICRLQLQCRRIGHAINKHEAGRN